MLLLTIASSGRCGGCFVRNPQTSSWLESLVSGKLGRRVRGRAVGKVLFDRNSLAAYPTLARAR